MGYPSSPKFNYCELSNTNQIFLILEFKFMSRFALGTHWLPQNGLLYTLFCLIFISEPRELQNLGISIEGICAKWLGSRTESFIQYQIRRFYFTIVFHASLPIFYACYLEDEYQRVFLQYSTLPLFCVLFIFGFYHFEVMLNPIEAQV